MTRKVRRTKEEIEAGITLTQKKDMIDQALVSKQQAKKNGVKNPAKVSPTLYEEYDPNTKTVYKYKTRTVEKEVIKEVPVIKEVRILNGTEGTETTVQEFLNEQLQKCRWEWKEIIMDGEFKSSIMTELGKEGWKMTHIMSWRIIKEDWKNKPDSMFFQRPIRTK